MSNISLASAFPAHLHIWPTAETAQLTMMPQELPPKKKVREKTKTSLIHQAKPIPPIKQNPIFSSEICQAVQSCMNWSSPGQALFAQPILRKSLGKPSRGTALALPRCPPFMGLICQNTLRSNQRSCKTYLSFIHQLIAAILQLGGEDVFQKTRTHSTFRLASTSAETVW